MTVATLLTIGLVVATAEIGVRLLSTRDSETGMRNIGRISLLPYQPDAAAAAAAWDRAKTWAYVVRDDELGWTIHPNGEADAGLYTSTAIGSRGPKNWTTTGSIPVGKTRVSLYGDSFTHGDEVQFEDTWAAQLQQLNRDYEVLNFGVPAYGTDQAFLRFRREAKKFDAQVHVLGIMPENIVRNLNVIRFYLYPQGSLGSSKPRFVLKSGQLTLVNSPVLSREAFLETVLHRNVSRVVAEHDYWYREDEQSSPWYYELQSVRAVRSVFNAYQRRAERNRLYYDRQAEALATAVAIAEAFAREVKAMGRQPYVAILPMRDLLNHESGAFPLADMLAAKSVPVIDLGPVFAAEAKVVGVDALYMPGNHFSARGNRLAAEHVTKSLAQGLGPR